jgi:membrane-associated phospholipid phosphatase
MRSYLAGLIWPLGLAVIFGVAFLMARRATGLAAGAGRSDLRPHRRRRVPEARSSRAMLTGAIRLVALAGAGAAVVAGLMALLGLLVVYHGLSIDRPIFSWVSGHQVHAVAAIMKRLTKTGDTWTTWGAAVAAAVCLTVCYRSRRWLPPVALASLIVIDHYTTLALRHTFHRLGPPTSPFGTYPSGGVDRVVVFYGLIGYLLWREFSGRRSTAIWIAAAVAALGFTEAYSRVYLSLHWFTDSVSGLIYGALLLTAFIAAVQVVAGRVTVAPIRPPDRRSAAADEGSLTGGTPV